MADPIAIATAVLALAVSIATAWLSYFHRGSIRMAEPSMVVFAYDPARPRRGFVPKVMVRCLLFSTGERGRIIETLFARMRIADSDYIFPVWGMDLDNKLVRGGGLLVAKGPRSRLASLRRVWQRAGGHLRTRKVRRRGVRTSSRTLTACETMVSHAGSFRDCCAHFSRWE